MTPPAQLAALLAQKFGAAAPVDLKHLCDALGLRIREVPARGFDGALVRSKAGQKGIVAVNQRIREVARKRFTIAHEIGHFIIPHHRLLPNICEEAKVEAFDTKLKRPEVEANEFAAELLLPSADLKRRLNLSDFSLKQISEVAGEYGTSLAATTRAFLQLTQLPCALVLSISDRAQWCARSEAFRFFLPLNELPAPGSLAASLFKGASAPSDFAPVPSIAWLDRTAAEQVPVLLEHSICLPNYRAVLTLLWAYKIDHPKEEDDELLEEVDPEGFTLSRKRWPR